MPAYTAVPFPGAEDEDERKRREQGLINAQANEAADAAFAAQQAAAPPPVEPAPPPVPVPVDELAEARKLVASAGGAVPLPAGGAPVPLIKKPTAKGEKAPEPGAAPVATVTSRAGGTTLETPLAPGGDIEQKTVRNAQTRSRVELAPGEKESQRDLQYTNEQMKDSAREMRDQAVAQAEAESQAADALRDLQAIRAGDVARHSEAAENEIARRQGIAGQAEEDWKRALSESETAKKTFWSRQDTDTKVRAGISLLLGIVGGLTDGSNVGAERIRQAIKDDSADFAQRAKNKLDILERSKGNVEDAKKDLRWKLELVDLRTAAALDSTAAMAVARAKKLGIKDAEIQGNQKILQLQQEAQDLRQKWLEGQRTKVESEFAQSRVVTDAGPGAAAGDKPMQKWSQGEKEADGYAQRMARASGDMDRYKYNPGDMQVIQNAKLQEQLLGTKGVGPAVIGRVLGSTFQRLSPEGKKRFLAEQDFARAVLRKESGAAIGIAEQEAEIEGIGERPGDNPDTLAQKRAQRVGRIQAVGTSSGRPGYWSQQAQHMGPQGSAPTTPGAAHLNATGGGGGRRGKVNGKPAVIYPDGTYELVQ